MAAFLAAGMFIGGTVVLTAAPAAAADCGSFPQDEGVVARTGRVGQSYAYSLIAPQWNTPGPYHLTSFAGEGPPPGLTLDDSGLLHGTPLLEGTTTWHIHVVDSGVPCTGSIVVTITIYGQAGQLVSTVEETVAFVLWRASPACVQAVISTLVDHTPPGAC